MLPAGFDLAAFNCESSTLTTKVLLVSDILMLRDNVQTEA